jgi:hypothetical protein
VTIDIIKSDVKGVDKALDVWEEMMACHASFYDSSAVLLFHVGQVWGLAPKVATLVTLGSPHQSLEAYPFGRAEVS